MEIIKEKEISLRLLREQDKNLLLKWLTDERVLNYWEGKSAIFDLTRIEEDFYSEEGLIRAIIEYQGQAIGYLQMYKLDNEALELYMKAFLSYKGREIFDFLSEDEINAMCIIVSESNREEQDPTKEKIYKVFEEQHKKALLEERKYIPNNDRKYLENMLDVMVEKHLIEIDGVRVSLSLGGMMHMYTLMKKDDDYEEENFDEDESLYS